MKSKFTSIRMKLLAALMPVVFIFSYSASAQSEPLLLFDGAESIVTTNLTPDDLGIEGGNPKTIEAWVNTRSFGEGGVFHIGTSSEGEEFALRTHGQDDVWMAQFWAAPDTEFTVPGSANAWTHLAISYEDGLIRVFANGEQVADNEATLNTQGDEWLFRVGAWRDQFFEGAIRDVRVWSVARSEQEIQDTMDDSPFGQTGLELWWPLNEGEGEIANDESGNDRDGEIFAAQWETRPFEFVQMPSDFVAWAGQSVAFEAEALLIADGELAYQWEVSDDGGETWQEIAGATEPSYTIASAGIELDGNRYRVNVIHDDLTEASDSALLRVGDGPAPAQEGVIAHYRFEEGGDGADATGAVDSSGNGYDLEVVIEVDDDTGEEFRPVYSSGVPASQVPQTGDDNDLSVDFSPGAVAFEGVDGEGLSTVSVDDFTIETFINFSDGGGWQTFIGRDDREDQTEDSHAIFYLQNRGDGNQFGVSWTDRNGNVVAPGLLGPVVQDNTWYHVAAVADLEAETISLYVNGVEVDRYEGFPGLFIPESPPSTSWSIGRGQWAGGSSDWVNARIDEVRFSDRPLTPTEFLGFSTAALNFLTQPEDVTAFVGDEVSFSALAGGGGTGELTYQWEVSEDGGETWSDISGATGTTYTIESAEFGLDGNLYRNVASRDGDTFASNTASLSVPDYPDPVIVEDLEQGALFFEGESVTYGVEATGVGNISYQWRIDGTDLEGETGNTVTFDPATTDLDESVLSVVIADDAAEEDDLEAKSVTLSTDLSVAPRLKRAIGLNFVGTSSDGGTFSDELGVVAPDQLAGAVPARNWNNSADATDVSTQETPLELVDDMGESTPASATWSANNTWAARTTSGPLSEKAPTDRLFHGYIEARSADGDPATVTIEGIPFDSYDVYVYPMGVEGAAGTFGRSVTMEDENGVRQFFMRNLLGNPTPEEIPLILSHATGIDEAMDGHMATYFRFAGASGDTVTLQHFDEVDWNSGGFAAVSIVDTSESTPARPVIVERPADRFLPGGGDLTLSVAAESYNEGGSLSFQWRKDGEDLGGETGASLTIGDATSADSGEYTVMITDDSNLGSSVNFATASVVVVDENRPALLSADMNVGNHEQMSGHGMLRADGLQEWVEPADFQDNPMEIGEGNTFWNALAGSGGTTSYDGLVDSQGLALPGVTFTVTGAGAAEDAPGGGGLEDLDADPTYSAPLFRDYVFTEGDDEMTLTVGGLQAFAGLDITLVVYAAGKDSAAWPDDENEQVDQNDVATVTLAEANNESNEAPVETDQENGREMRWNDRSFAAFEARVAANGTVSWTIGPVAGEPGLNAFNGFQLRVTSQGEAIEPEGIADWRQDFFGTSANEGDAANGADPDGDGFVNLMEYALGTDPTVAGEAHSAVVRGRDGDFLTLSFNHIADPDLTYAVEATDDLAGEWVEVANFGSFASEGTQTYTDDQAVGDNPSRFLRLKVTIAE